MSMYDKNHYNIVISLQLIKINEKKDNYVLIHQNACLKNGETKKQTFWPILTLMSS